MRASNWATGEENAPPGVTRVASYEAQPIPIGGAALLTTSDGRLVRVRVHGLPTRDETIALRFDDDRVETHPIAMLQRAR